jgi:polysaccharide biosynthesis transport protein
MSKNFELLQQAGIGLGAVPAATDGPTEVEAKSQARPTAAEKAGAATQPGVREEALKLVQKLFLSQGQAAPKAVMFAAVDPKNGCSRLCAVIAKLLAESVSASVCLVEGNFRTSSLPELLGVPSYLGLADSLRQEGPIRGFATQVGRDNFWLLSAGSQARDSASLLNCDQMRERVAELRKEFDYLLIDAPSLSAYADGMVFGRLTDGVVLVLEANETRREAALRVVENVRALNIPVLGAVLNNRTFPIPSTLYKRL